MSWMIVTFVLLLVLMVVLSPHPYLRQSGCRNPRPRAVDAESAQFPSILQINRLPRNQTHLLRRL